MDVYEKMLKYQTYTVEELYEALNNVKASYNFDNEEDFSSYRLEKSYIKQLLVDKNYDAFHEKYKDNKSANNLRMIRLKLIEYTKDQETYYENNHNNLESKEKYQLRVKLKQLKYECHYLYDLIDSVEYNSFYYKYKDYSLEELKSAKIKIKEKISEEYNKYRRYIDEGDNIFESKEYFDQYCIIYSLTKEEMYVSDTITYDFELKE